MFRNNYKISLGENFYFIFENSNKKKKKIMVIK